MKRSAWSVDDVRALGTTTDIVTAGAVLGVGRTTSYQLARDGEFPVPVTRAGRRFIVGVPHLLRAIGATEPDNTSVRVGPHGDESQRTGRDRGLRRA